MDLMDSAMIAPVLLVLNIYFRNIINPYVMLLFCSVGKIITSLISSFSVLANY